jgi:hypothetical protein
MTTMLLSGAPLELPLPGDPDEEPAIVDTVPVIALPVDPVPLAPEADVEVVVEVAPLLVVELDAAVGRRLPVALPLLGCDAPDDPQPARCRPRKTAPRKVGRELIVPHPRRGDNPNKRRF